jgi:hypothetical protein
MSRPWYNSKCWNVLMVAAPNISSQGSQCGKLVHGQSLRGGRYLPWRWSWPSHVKVHHLIASAHTRIPGRMGLWLKEQLAAGIDPSLSGRLDKLTNAAAAQKTLTASAVNPGPTDSVCRAGLLRLYKAHHV